MATEIQEYASTLVRDDPLPGYGDLVERYTQRGMDEDEVVGVLERTAGSAGLPAPSVRGVQDPFRWLVRQFRGRELLEDLGIRILSVPWLALHVPPRGTAELSWQVQMTGGLSCSVKVFGTGGGRGRAVRWKVEATVGERSTCLRLFQDVQVRLSRYRAATGEEFVAGDVEGARARRLVSWPDCPLCGVPTAGLDPFDVELGEAVDLSDYRESYTESVEQELTDTSSLSVGLTLPAPLQGELGFDVERERQLSCAVTYTFEPGGRYQPYHLVTAPQELPPWALG